MQKFQDQKKHLKKKKKLLLNNLRLKTLNFILLMPFKSLFIFLTFISFAAFAQDDECFVRLQKAFDDVIKYGVRKNPGNERD